ncbi:MAG TPA: cyclopropane fatty acyl phospholipid synthase [Gammaproteobacteria bacterium]|nr:cyclopropane fatty acyl phospholipid synthase [Gammaproteobacteria bacterium]
MTTTAPSGTAGRLERKAARLLALADVRIGGDRPWDIQVHDPRLFARVFAHGSLGFGESYMDGWWDAERLDELLTRVIGARLDRRMALPQKAARWLLGQLVNLQSGRRAFTVGKEHYDRGNDLFERMLDRRMTYSCGYWKDATTLDEAQEAKLDLACRKLGLEAGMRLLDIGCGWGGMAKFAAERYGVSVVGITVSKEQAEYGQHLCAGLPVEIRVEDYRAHRGAYDRIVSIGMFEHVGHRNYRRYFTTARRLLKPDGLFLLHAIHGNVSLTRTDPWIEKYIFPNGMIPSPRQVTRAIERLFVIEDLHNFGADYDKTLMSWYANFERAWPELRERYGERFRRMWRFYLMASAASFRTRSDQLFQILLSPGGVPGGLRVPR